jgi:hypothetical protein
MVGEDSRLFYEARNGASRCSGSVRREEREEAVRNDREAFGEEGRGGEAEREDLAE